MYRSALQQARLESVYHAIKQCPEAPCSLQCIIYRVLRAERHRVEGVCGVDVRGGAAVQIMHMGIHKLHRFAGRDVKVARPCRIKSTSEQATKNTQPYQSLTAHDISLIECIGNALNSYVRNIGQLYASALDHGLIFFGRSVGAVQEYLAT